MRIKTIHIFFLFLFKSIGFATESAPVSVASQVDKSKITIGDLIRYTVAVTHGEKIQIEMPGPGANLGGFEIRNYKVQEPEKQNGQIVSSSEYTLSTFFTGEFIIPPLMIAYKMPSDTAVYFLSTDKIKIIVESVKPSEAGDIKDIKPPLEIPRNWWLVARNAGIVLFILVLAVSGWVGYRRWKQGKSLMPVRVEPPRPPHEIALEELDRLKNSDLLGKGEIKQFHVELSDIIRRYIEGRYFIIAMEMTTSEVLQNLASTSVLDGEEELFKEFLGQCDLVKFAKYIPSNPEIETCVNQAYDIVHKTKIVIEEESVPLTGMDAETLPEPVSTEDKPKPLVSS